MRVRPRSRMQMHKGNNLDRWTVSFADFMTLMFAVFVVLYAVSLNDKAQYKAVMESIQNSSKLLNQAVFSSNNDGILTHNSNNIIEDAGPGLLSATPANLVEEKQYQQADNELSDSNDDDKLKTGSELKQLKLALEGLFRSELKDKSIELDLNGDWLTIEMGGEILFAGGSHTLLNSAHAVVKKTSKVLLEVNNLLRIRGYSDNNKISNELYRSNWELSGMRAFSVLHALNKQGISGERMVVEAYGRFSPVLNADKRINNLKSRRVVIAISKYAVLSASEKTPVSMKASSETQAPLPKPDSKEMHEVHLPNDRLIITTRQE